MPNIDEINKSQEDYPEIGEITTDLTEWGGTDVNALDKVFVKVYKNLENLAKKARKSIGLTDSADTYNSVGLANEMYFKLRKNRSIVFENRKRFYAFCLLVMTNLLKDYYWKKSSKKNEIRLLDKLKTNNDEDTDFQIENLMDLSTLSDYGDKYESIELAIVVNHALNS